MSELSELDTVGKRRIRVKALVQMLEGSAPNTDTCWQWRAATALREMPQWETAEIIDL